MIGCGAWWFQTKPSPAFFLLLVLQLWGPSPFCLKYNCGFCSRRICWWFHCVLGSGGKKKKKLYLGGGSIIFIWLFKIHIRVWISSLSCICCLFVGLTQLLVPQQGISVRSVLQNEAVGVSLCFTDSLLTDMFDCLTEADVIFSDS